MASPIINVMSAAAVKAGKGLLRDFGEVDQLQISRKGTSNFVTNSDIRTEKLLQKELSKAKPDYGFLLEEGGEIAGKDAQYRWIIDPLDGTTNFIHAIPYFCISIALEKRMGETSDIVAAVIFDPIHNELFAAEKGKGGTVNDRKLSVSSRSHPEEIMLVTGSQHLALHAPGGAQPLFNDAERCNSPLRYFGATALDLANLAAGRIDGCWYHIIQPWDIAAGLLLIREAGGMVTECDGRPATAYSKPILAANPLLHPSLQKLVAK